MASKYYHYYVEGQTDEKMVSILKTEYQLVVPGKVERFNIIEKELTPSRTIGLRIGTIVVLIFDTDTKNTSILVWNCSVTNQFSYIINEAILIRKSSS